MRLVVAGLVIAIFAIAIVVEYVGGGTEPDAYPYSELMSDAAAGRVRSITQDGLRLTVVLTDGTQRSASVASESVNAYAEACAAAGEALGTCSIRYEAVEPSATGQWLGLLITALLPVLLIGAFVYFMMRQAQRTQNKP